MNEDDRAPKLNYEEAAEELADSDYAKLVITQAGILEWSIRAGWVLSRVFVVVPTLLLYSSRPLEAFVALTILVVLLTTGVVGFFNPPRRIFANRLTPDEAERFHGQVLMEMQLVTFLEMACRSSELKTGIAVSQLRTFPRAWMQSRIEPVSRHFLDLEDPKEYEKLIEVYRELGMPAHLRRLIKSGLESKREKIVAIAKANQAD